MDHKTFLASLELDEKAALTKRSDAAGLQHLALHMGAILCFSFPIFFETMLGWLFVLPLGILLVFLFTLLHETSHNTPFESAWLNLWIGRICGFILFLPPKWFQYFHFAHHRHTNDPEHDPELEGGKPETWPQYLWHLTGIPVWHSHGKMLLQNALGKTHASYIPQKRWHDVRLESLTMIALYVLVFAVAWVFEARWVLTCWLLPLLLGQPFLRLYLLAEHGHCPPVSNMFENTRTTFTSRLVRFLAWNMPYHAEHHAYPAVPFHRLPELHQKTQAHLASTSSSYHAFHREYQRELR